MCCTAGMAGSPPGGLCGRCILKRHKEPLKVIYFHILMFITFEHIFSSDVLAFSSRTTTSCCWGQLWGSVLTGAAVSSGSRSARVSRGSRHPRGRRVSGPAGRVLSALVTGVPSSAHGLCRATGTSAAVGGPGGTRCDSSHLE